MVTASSSNCNRILAEAGIPALVYKGAPLSTMTTGSALARACSDVDVLVPPTAVQAAVDAMTAGIADASLGDTGTGMMSRFAECELSIVGRGAAIDLHWRIDSGTGFFRIPFDELWDRRIALQTSELSVNSLSPIDSLLVTSVHGCRELWHRWKWALDAVRQVESVPEAEWPAYRALADRAGAGRALAVTVAVARLGGARVSDTMQPGLWATQFALRCLTVGSAPTDPAMTPRAALSRRRARAQVADNRLAALDDVARGLTRQLVEARNGKLAFRWKRYRATVRSKAG